MADEGKQLTKAEAMRILRRLQGKSISTMHKQELELAVKATSTLLQLSRSLPFIKIVF